MKSDFGFIPDVPYDDAIKIPQIELKVPTKELYTFDKDAPYPAPNNISSPYAHLFIYNLPDGDINNGDYLLEYAPLNPLRDSPIHVYYANLYLQPSSLTYRKGPLANRDRSPYKKW